MNDYLQAVINALCVIHTENMLIMATLTDQEMTDDFIKQIDNKFMDAISKIVKK